VETYKTQPIKERKSQKLNFWDFTKEKLFWVALPFMTAGGAMLIGKLTKFKIWPLDGSPDLLSTIYAKGTKFFAEKHGLKGGKEVEDWLKKGAFAGDIIEEFGGESKEKMRKYYFNMVKGAEVATPFSAYFLWHKKEGNRLDLEQAGDALKTMQTLKFTDAELAERNEAMRRELEFANTPGNPPAIIDKAGLEYHGRVTEPLKQRL
jgi:hypothetical protein